MNFKKNHPYIVGVLLVVLIAVVIYLLFGGTDYKKALADSEVKIAELQGKIDASVDREGLLKNQLTALSNELQGTGEELTLQVQKVERLKRELSKVPPPADPVAFRELSECKEEYSRLHVSYSLCLDKNDKTDSALQLCLDKTQKQAKFAEIQEVAYLECQNQGANKDLQIKELRHVIDKMNRSFKSRRFWSGVKNFSLGAVVGVAAYAIVSVVK